MKRIKLRSEKPNPLFQQWLQEWREEAASRNSDLQHSFSKALASLKRYPLPLKSGQDCIILQHFGKKLCSMLDKRLEEYKAENKDSKSSNGFVCVHCDYSKKHVSRRKYKLQQIEADMDYASQRTELAALGDNDARTSSQIHKSRDIEIVTSEKNVQQVDEYIVKQKPKQNNVHAEKAEKTKTIDKCALNKAGNSKTNSTDDLRKDIYLESNTFDVILLVDTQETSGGKTKPQHDATLVELSELGVIFEVRHLKVGDFTWIARCRATNNELILPYIVERKRMDDLSASITDGRFYEQKFRLKQSGVENLMYIIEEYGKRQRLAIPHASLLQASVNTLIQDGFSVKYTKHHKDSMFYLSSLTRILSKTFKEKDLVSCRKENVGQVDLSSSMLNLMEFQDFNRAASKQKVFKVSEMFIRQLLQLKGVSVDKATAIVERYPTPRILIDALQRSDCNGELLLSSIQLGDKKRRNVYSPTITVKRGVCR